MKRMINMKYIINNKLSYSKTKFITYLSLILILYLFAISFNLINPSQEIINPNKLHIIDIVRIFIVNMITIFIWFLLSHLGLSFIAIINFVFSMILAGIQYGNNTYHLSSISHGVGELLVTFIIFCYSIDYVLALIHLYKTGEKKAILNRFKFFIKEELLFITGILLISAILEVIVSNQLFILFI